MDERIRTILQRGVVIPACPLALDSGRRFDQRRQRALLRYYSAAGVGGVAVGVHTTQFAIRDPGVGLFEPVLELAADEMNRLDSGRQSPLVRIGGICGPTTQALREAELLRKLGYAAGLLSLSAMKDADDHALIEHCRAVAEVIPIMGFYLQPAVGGRDLGYGFWQRFVEIENVVAIKIAPFNRYFTIDVARAVAESGRDDIALYTGNDDSILLDLLTPMRFRVGGSVVEQRIVGGLLAHWAVWTRGAVQMLEECRAIAASGNPIPQEMLVRAAEVTDCDAAFFDPVHGFAGCIPGIYEVLRRQGLFEGIYLLDTDMTLSPGQSAEIDRVYAAYPHLNDDDFVSANLDDWLSG